MGHTLNNSEGMCNCSPLAPGVSVQCCKRGPSLFIRRRHRLNLWLIILTWHYFLLQIIIAGERGAADTEELLRCVYSKYLPNKIVLLADGDEQNNFLYQRLGVLRSLVRKDNKATAYVCENYTCQKPVNSVKELEKLLFPAEEDEE